MSFEHNQQDIWIFLLSAVSMPVQHVAVSFPIHIFCGTR